MKKGLFITFDGGEGAGKSTHAVKLYDALRAQGIPTVYTREPGGTRIAESIRKVLLDPANTITPLTELFLYEAARVQHIADIIQPALDRGKVVICDRFTDSTVAYQGYARGLHIDIIRRLNDIATQGLKPDITIYLDVPVKKGLSNARSLGKGSHANGDRLERESLAFHTRVRQGYLALARRNRARITVIRLGRTIEETHRRIVRTVATAIRPYVI